MFEPHLRSHSAPVTEELSIGFDVVGVYSQGLRVQLVGRIIVPVLEGLVPILLLGFECFGILDGKERALSNLCKLKVCRQQASGGDRTGYSVLWLPLTKGWRQFVHISIIIRQVS